MKTLGARFAEEGFKGPGFDVLRLIAASAVVVHHSFEVAFDAVGGDYAYQLSGGYIHLGYWAVAVFFVISGFLVTPGLKRTSNVVDFAVRRIVRIYPGLIVIVGLTALVLGPVLTRLSPAEYFTDPGVLTYFKNILPLTINHLPGVVLADGRPAIVNGALWTLFFEVICYGALGALSVLGFLKVRSAFLAVLLAAFALHNALAFGLLDEARFSGLFITFNGLFVYFGAGVAAYLYADRLPWSPLAAALALVAILIAMPLGFSSLVVPLATAYLAIFLGLARMPLPRPLEGRDLSYGIYLIHSPVLITLRIFFPGLANWPLTVAIVLPIAAGLAYLSWTFIESPALSRKSVIARAVNQRMERIVTVLPPLRILTGAPLKARPTRPEGS